MRPRLALLVCCAVVAVSMFFLARLAQPACVSGCYRAPCEVNDHCPPGCDCIVGRCQ